MMADMVATAKRQRARHELLRQYVQLQHELIEADPSSSAYQGIIHAFRQMGYVLITSGFEEDLDRLLRIRVLDGGLEMPTTKSERAVPGGVKLVKRSSS